MGVEDAPKQELEDVVEEGLWQPDYNQTIFSGDERRGKVIART